MSSQTRKRRSGDSPDLERELGPDFSKNHIHVYWDKYTADQVSNDAAARGVTQGEWVPTGDYPQYVTEGAVSTSVRGDSPHGLRHRG